MKKDIENRKKEQTNGKNSDNTKKDQVHQDVSIPACKEVWSEDEDNQAITSESIPLATSSAPQEQESKVQTQFLDPDTIYWDEVEEIFVHASGMYFDPGAKAYYTVIDQSGEDLRPLYYSQSGGDFSLVVNSKFG